MGSSKKLQKTNSPRVLVTAPSLEIFKVLSDATKVLEDFNIPYEKSIMAAHWDPKTVFRIAPELESKGIELVIATAAGSAHLPGMIASLTSIPVIGVPYRSELLGLESLFSMLEMPQGIPVGVMGINSALNAGLFAIQILGLNNPDLQKKFQIYRKSIAQRVSSEDKKLNKK